MSDKVETPVVIDPAGVFSGCGRLQAVPTCGGDGWTVVDSQGSVIASLSAGPLTEARARCIANALNAFHAADASLLDDAASYIGSMFSADTYQSRGLRDAARELCGGDPYASCGNDECGWSGHAPAPEDADYLPCPRCGESASIVR